MKNNLIQFPTELRRQAVEAERLSKLEQGWCMPPAHPICRCTLGDPELDKQFYTLIDNISNGTARFEDLIGMAVNVKLTRPVQTGEPVFIKDIEKSNE